MIRCPYCLNRVAPKLEVRENKLVYVCPIKECDTEIHRDYVEKPQIPRTMVGLVGFTGHGKTVYLTALFYLLTKVISRKGTWEEDSKEKKFICQTLDDNTHNIMYKHVPLFQDSQLPPGTPENFPHPALIQFGNIPKFGDWFLSLYDTAGSVYEETEKITKMGRFVAHCEVVLFVISIKDCGKNWGDRMKGLLETYIRGVYDKLHIDLENQHLIVILSKADDINEFPEGLKGFLQEGTYKWYSFSNPQDKGVNFKLEELKEISKVIKGWLKEKECRDFINLAEQNFRSVEYTIVSSTGAAPVGDRLATKLQPEDPKRVLDPFLWVLEKTRPRGMWERIFKRGW